MALPSFARDAITVVRPASKVVRGTTTVDWSNVKKIPVRGCSVQPGDTTTDQASDRDSQASETATVYLPPNADARTGDRVIYDGDTWDVVGRVQTWRSPSGRITHKIMRIRVHQG